MDEIKEHTQLELPLPITNGVELARRIGCNLDEGVVVALFPDTLSSVVTAEASILDKKGDHLHMLLADCGPWGIRLLDLQSVNGIDVKFWMVKEAAGIERTSLIPIRWEGPIAEIPERYFAPNAFLGVRFYAHGPWFFPGEKPTVSETVKADTALQQAAEGLTSGP
jgi:hypothetical protein